MTPSRVDKPIKREFSEVQSKELTNLLLPKCIKREFSEVKSNELTNTVQKKKTKLKSALELGLEL